MAKVLVVDDTMFMRHAIKTMLAGSDYEVVGEASNGKEAIEKYRELLPDVVTMDVTMPIMTGLDATKMIIDEYPDAKIIVISALGQQKMIIQALENGAKDFIMKPFDQESLLSTIVKVMED
ncbi:response regulator [Viridibacillus sp. YIM B01967]|uniref:Response regulator n=1 Tax=Viridibacillus soli TaxID=2798301 RepID=A0ABS1H866_9BACL|nr:response regulator [Viridibacillus soli]MBK3495213.1 response regulator [Viridibacillus soli]